MYFKVKEIINILITETEFYWKFRGVTVFFRLLTLAFRFSFRILAPLI